MRMTKPQEQHKLKWRYVARQNDSGGFCDSVTASDSHQLLTRTFGFNLHLIMIFPEMSNLMYLLHESRYLAARYSSRKGTNIAWQIELTLIPPPAA